MPFLESRGPGDRTCPVTDVDAVGGCVRCPCHHPVGAKLKTKKKGTPCERDRNHVYYLSSKTAYYWLSSVGDVTGGAFPNTGNCGRQAMARGRKQPPRNLLLLAFR